MIFLELHQTKVSSSLFHQQQEFSWRIIKTKKKSPRLILLRLSDITRPASEAGPGRARASKVRGFREGWAWTPRHWVQITDDTGVGDPAQATAAKGEAYLAAVSVQLGEFLVELADADPAKLYEP